MGIQDRPDEREKCLGEIDFRIASDEPAVLFTMTPDYKLTIDLKEMVEYFNNQKQGG